MADAPDKQVIVVQGIPVTRPAAGERRRRLVTIAGLAAALWRLVGWTASAGLHATVFLILIAALLSSRGVGRPGPTEVGWLGVETGTEEETAPEERSPEPPVEETPPTPPEPVPPAASPEPAPTVGDSDTGADAIAADGGSASTEGGSSSDSGGTTGGAFYGLGIGGTRIVFILDRSGSMRERGRGRRARIDVLKSEMRRALEDLPADARFDIVVFDEEIDFFDPDLVEATQENRGRAAAFLSGVRPRAGTNIHLPIAWSLDRFAGHGSLTAYLYTDGEPNRGPMEGATADRVDVTYGDQLDELRAHLGDLERQEADLERRRAGWRTMREEYEGQTDNPEGVERVLRRLDQWEADAGAERGRLDEEANRTREVIARLEEENARARQAAPAAGGALISCGDPDCRADGFWTAIHHAVADAPEVKFFTVFEGVSGCGESHMRRLAEETGGRYVHVTP